MSKQPAFTAETWPIATCLHGFPPVGKDGVAMHDAEPSVWDDMFAQIEAVDFNLAELADSHVRPADLEPSRRDEFLSIAKSHGIGIPSVHLQRQSVIMPGHEERNLEYAHRTIDAAAEWGMEVFSTGLHQPFSEAQKKALWFWTAEGSTFEYVATAETARVMAREYGPDAATRACAFVMRDAAISSIAFVIFLVVCADLIFCV